MWNIFKDNVKYYTKNVFIKFFKEIYQSIKFFIHKADVFFQSNESLSHKFFLLSLIEMILIFSITQYLFFVAFIILISLFTVVVIIFRTIIEYFEKQ